VPRSGLQYAAQLEWRLAAQWAHYRYEDFQMLEGEQQSQHVAAYRIHSQAEALLQQEGARQSRKPAPTQRPRSHR